MSAFPIKAIGVVGSGVVGSAIARTYMPYCQVCVNDRDKMKSGCDLVRLLDLAEIIFLCLPTPQKKDSLELDTSAIRDFLQFARYASGSDKFLDLPLVLKSTTPIGFTRSIRDEYQLRHIVHSPEFLTERTAYADSLLPSRNIIGTVRGSSAMMVDRLKILYQARFSGVQIQVFDSDESEAIKLMTNAFFATKISFFNEMYGLCEAMKLDWQSVLSGILSDGRISHSHTMVPGPDGKFGFGGKCLPKDLAQIIHHMLEDHTNIGSIITGNVLQRNKVLDRR